MDYPQFSPDNLKDFQTFVLAKGRESFRVMPWRNIDDAYGVLVSEVMLQQTQVARVTDKWLAWMKRFPTVDALAVADTAEVLRLWQGLGYNRRALNLQRAAQVCAETYGGKLPKTVEELQALPGIGPATAAGVMAFAYDAPGVYLETNVRTVFIYSFFPHEAKVADKQLIPLVKAACPDEGVRQWYYALLDYGAELKATFGRVDPAKRSTGYAKQSKFEGSHRQKRAAVLRIVLDDPELTSSEIFARLQQEERLAGREPVAHQEFDEILRELTSEGFFSLADDRVSE